MRSKFDQPSWWQRWRPVVVGYDGPLLAVVLVLAVAGLLTMYSVGYDHGTRFVDHGRNMLLAAMLMLVVGQVSPQRLMALAVPLYTVGVMLLVATALFGLTRKGATRWLNVGVVIQPSEILKLAMPLMLAWWFQRREGQLRAPDFAVAAGLLLLPVGLVAKQPDLGTAILILSGGLYVIFFAGLSWRLIAPLVVLAAIAIAAVVISAVEFRVAARAVHLDAFGFAVRADKHAQDHTTLFAVTPRDRRVDRFGRLQVLDARRESLDRGRSRWRCRPRQLAVGGRQRGRRDRHRRRHWRDGCVERRCRRHGFRVSAARRGVRQGDRVGRGCRCHRCKSRWPGRCQLGGSYLGRGRRDGGRGWSLPRRWRRLV